MQSVHDTQLTAPVPASQGAIGRLGRLKYADARDLPSFPSLGLRQNDAAASAAATLGWANQQKPVEQPYTNPRGSSTSLASASAAATLLSNVTGGHKVPPRWEPTATAAEKSGIGSRAAILAAAGGAARRQEDAAPTAAVSGSPGGPSPTSAWGSSAANRAFKAGAEKSTVASNMASTSTDTVLLRRRGSLHAAKDAMAGTTAGRPRARSSPTPGEKTTANPTAKTALTAATYAHKRTVSADSISAVGAVPYTTMSRQMFTSHPPIGIEVEEQKRADLLHASAVAMARRLYSQRQKEADTAANPARQAQQGDLSRAGPQSSDVGSSSQPSSPRIQQPVPFVNLQEAAYKLAQDRLAKLHEEHQRNRDYQDYYRGTSGSSVRGGFSIRSKLRRRSSSDGALSLETGGKRSPLLHKRHTSLFFSPLEGSGGGSGRQNPGSGVGGAAFDEERRQRDREALLAAARRNVKAQLEGIDRKVFEETGKGAVPGQSPSEQKAHVEALLARSEAIVAASASASLGGRMGHDRKKVDIGGGKLMDRTEIDEIAYRRVQPFLEEINEKAENERERLEMLRIEEENRRREAELKRAKEKEVHNLHMKLKAQQKDQDRARRDEIKREKRSRKEVEKELKQQTKEDRQHSKKMPRPSQQQQTPDTSKEDPGSPPAMETQSIPADGEGKGRPSRARSLHLRLTSKLQPTSKRYKGSAKEAQSPTRPQTTLPTPPAEEGASPGEGSGSPASKVKNWLRSRFRPRARSSVEPGSFNSHSDTRVKEKRQKEKRKKDSDGGEVGGFIGGAALAAATSRDRQRSLSEGKPASPSASSSSTSPNIPRAAPIVPDDGNPSSSMQDVAPAGRQDVGQEISGASAAGPTTATVFPTTASTSTPNASPPAAGDSVNSLSSGSSHRNFNKDNNSRSGSSSNSSSSSSSTAGREKFVMARDRLSGTFSPPRAIQDPAAPTTRATKTGSPVRDSKFLEMME